ncbi:MAG: zinc dependent phospholipase C family protein [Culicoidibacterales bacterium]
MLSQTHRLIAKQVSKLIYNRIGFQIEEKYFYYGAIAPDLHPDLFFSMTHTREGSETFVFAQCQRILDTEWTEKNSRRLAYTLGVMSHFIADYHCYPHVYTREYDENFRAHFQYELRMHQKMKRFRTQQLLLNNDQIPITTVAVFREQLDYFAYLYDTTPHSKEKDLRFAVAVNTLLLSGLLKKTFDN